MSKISDQVLGTSDVGCCVTRVSVCHCHDHINEAARIIGGKLRDILNRPDAVTNLVAFIDQLEHAR